jgi:hypothetical protein
MGLSPGSRPGRGFIGAQRRKIVECQGEKYPSRLFPASQPRKTAGSRVKGENRLRPGGEISRKVRCRQDFERRRQGDSGLRPAWGTGEIEARPGASGKGGSGPPADRKPQAQRPCRQDDAGMTGKSSVERRGAGPFHRRGGPKDPLPCGGAEGARDSRAARLPAFKRLRALRRA